MRPVRNYRADIAATDDAENLAAELDPHEPRLFPFAGLGRAVGHRDLARQREHHRDRVLCGGDRIAVRGIHDDDAALGGGGDVDIVDADPGAADDLELRRGGEQLGRDLGGRTHRESLIAGDALLQLGRAEPGRDSGRDTACGEDLDRTRAQLIGNQYFRHSRPRSFTMRQ